MTNTIDTTSARRQLVTEAERVSEAHPDSDPDALDVVAALSDSVCEITLTRDVDHIKVL